MNAVETLLSQPVVQALGWALIHFLWQGALVALLLWAAGASALRRASANARYLAACAALLSMLALPAVTTLYINADARAQASAQDATTQTAGDRAAPAPTKDGNASSQASAVAAPTTPSSYLYNVLTWPFASEAWRPSAWLAVLLPWLVSMWLAGVVLLSLRVLGGWAVTRRLTRRAVGEPALRLQETVERLSARLRVSRPVRLCESLAVEVPTVVGWLRPVVLLPVSALSGLSVRQIEALLAHELAHVRRHDYLVNMTQTAVETLLFYHPAVWWVSREIRAERENCCDDLAVEACGDVLTYARALAELEQLRAAAPQLALAADGGRGGLLIQRVRRLIEAPPPAHRASTWAASLIVLATVFGVWAGARTTALVEATAHRLISGANAEAAPAPGAQDVRADDARATVDDPAGNVRRRENPEADAVDDANIEADTNRDFGPAFDRQVDADVDADTAADVDEDLRDEDPAAGVQGERKSEDRDDGARASAEASAQAAAEGGDLAAQMAAVGYPNLSFDDLVAFRTHGVSAEFVRQMKAAGYERLDPDTLVAFRIHGVTPEFARGWAAEGYRDVSAENLIAFRIHGVTPEHARALRPLVVGTVSADDLVAFGVHGVTPAFIEEMKNVGLGNISAEDLVAFRIHGVTPAFVRAVAGEGLRLSADDAVALRIHAVTPEFIRQVKARNLTDLNVSQLLALKQLGIVR